MKPQTKENILKVIGFLILFMVLLVLFQYLNVLHKKNQKSSSETINTVEENDEILHTEIELQDRQKFMDNVKRNMVQEITSKLRNQMENFSNPQVCKSDLTESIYYLYLETRMLETQAFKPRPIWTNDVFCIYKLEPVLSLDATVNGNTATEQDYYYPLGDILLLKDFPNYVKNYQSVLDSINKSREVKECKVESNNSNNKSNNNNANNNNANNNNDNNNNANNNNSNNNNSEGFVGGVVAPKDVPPPDTYITNYDQPGLDGLKIMIKNGKKPLGFEPAPVCVINGSTGENLYFWRPIPPPEYISLGDITTIGVTPIPPTVDSCKVRCIPKECLDNVPLDARAIVASPDILPPYKIKMVSNGKYLKGLADVSTHDGIQSYDFNTRCLNIEREQNDTRAKVDITINNTSASPGQPTNLLTAAEFNLLLNDFMIAFQNKLIQDDRLKLNNVLNNKEIDARVFNVENMRFTLEVKFLVTNQFILSIILKKRAFAYGEIGTPDIITQLQKHFKEILNVQTRVGGKDYYLQPIAIVINNLGMSPQESNIKSALENAIILLEEQINIEKAKNALGPLVLDNLDLLVMKLKNLVTAIVDDLTYKKQLAGECMRIINKILEEIITFEVPKLKEVLEEIKIILEELKVVIETGTDEGDGRTALNPEHQIDENLKEELITLGKLALRKDDSTVNLNSLIKYDVGLNNNKLSISELKKMF